VNNRTIAQFFREHARRLEQEEMTLFRVRAWRRAADQIEELSRPLEEIYREQGRAGLKALPGVGDHLAYTLEGLLSTGKWRVLHPEETAQEPDRQLISLPGIGPWLALRLRERLGITTLEELDQAIRADRLGDVGIGPARLHHLREALAQRLGAAAAAPGEPRIADLLQLDADYRERVKAQALPLPWHLERNGVSYRVDFCRNTLARRLQRTRDWVEVRYTGPEHQGQRLVVTEERGDLQGRRIVRGRERECRAYYHSTAQRPRTGLVLLTG
jgi:hypothetical protein